MGLVTSRSYCRDITFTLLGLQDRLVPSAVNSDKKGGVSPGQKSRSAPNYSSEAAFYEARPPLYACLLNPQKNMTETKVMSESENKRLHQKGCREKKKGGLRNYILISKNLKRQWRHLQDTGPWKSRLLIPLRFSPLQGTV